MKRENRLDPKTRSPEPDDLSNDAPILPPSHRPADRPSSAARTNPDVSEPHVPPPDDADTEQTPHDKVNR